MIAYLRAGLSINSSNKHTLEDFIIFLVVLPASPDNATVFKAPTERKEQFSSMSIQFVKRMISI